MIFYILKLISDRWISYFCNCGFISRQRKDKWFAAMGHPNSLGDNPYSKLHYPKSLYIFIVKDKNKWIENLNPTALNVNNINELEKKAIELPIET
jgi:hypothetical protein